MMPKSCCVTGHRDIPDDKVEYVRTQLQQEIDSAIADGYNTFYSGFAEGADQLFAAIVADRKQDNKDLHLVAAIPHPKRLKQLEGDAEATRLLGACDSVGVHSREYTPDCFKRRNQFMVEESGRCIAVHDGRPRGGTASTMRYAQELDRELRVVNI